ncbi:hypothetical protein [Streptomyces sp. NPDC008121]|uniref:hypothetical protein n=1 Tax=Streptomyces sp. NPDC008121 TaxID=3364809 RepID=UPI0036E8483E
MISEPELMGGPAAPAPEPLRLGPDPVPPSPPRPRRPWPWALGGALTASAVWAGGLVVWDGVQNAGPDLGGYRTVESLCQKAELKALSTELGKRAEDPAANEPTARHPALDRARCSVTLGSPDSGYTVDVRYDLHKKTDPGPEFVPDLGDMTKQAEPVEGLGEAAYVSTDADSSGPWIAVLDGQAQLDIWVSRQQTWDVEKGEAVEGAGKSDLSGVETLLVQDMRALMAALKA